MRMKTLYAALSGAFLLGTAALSDAQNMTTTTTTDKPTTPQSSAVHSARDKIDKVTTAATPGPNAGQGISRDEYKREKDRIEAEAKAAKEKCKSLSGNTRDICQAEAKANEKVAKKELDYKNKPTEKNKYEWEKMKIEAKHEVAKEKCEDQKGAEMASCKKAAKEEQKRELAALKGDHKVAKAGGTSSTTPTPQTSPTTGTKK